MVDTRAEVATALLVDFSGSTVTKEKRISNNIIPQVGVGLRDGTWPTRRVVPSWLKSTHIQQLFY